MKKILTIFMTVLMMGVVWGNSSKTVLASDNQSGEVMIAKEEVAVKETTDTESGTIVTYSGGETVFVTGETNGWYIVIYQGKTGYVLKDKLKKMTLDSMVEQSSNENAEAAKGTDEGKTVNKGIGENTSLETKEQLLDVELKQKEDEAHQEYLNALNAEMGAVEAESKMVIEEVERQREERKHSSLWGIVIVGLIIGIFATGLISTRKVNKKEDTEIIDLDKEN